LQNEEPVYNIRNVIGVLTDNIDSSVT